MKDHRHIGFLLLAVLLLLEGCTSSEQTVQRRSTTTEVPAPVALKYTSAFPQNDVSKQINTISRSVKRITISGIYRIYYFEDEPVTLNQIQNSKVEQMATRSIAKEESVAGTAISIAQNQRFITLLTCAHVVQFPDTLIEYVESKNLPEKEYVQSIAIKYNQNNLVYGETELASFEIESINTADDLALIQVDKINKPDLNIPPLPVKLGDSKNLKWGSFLYIFGYPKGNAVVTRAIVSHPNRTSKGDFLTDALFNHGMSGGIILASNNNFATFEWVGMANTTSAEEEHLLVPDPSLTTSDKLTEPYDGPIYQERKIRISYGVTQSIPTADITDFLEENRDLFKNSVSELLNF